MNKPVSYNKRKFEILNMHLSMILKVVFSLCFILVFFVSININVVAHASELNYFEKAMRFFNEKGCIEYIADEDTGKDPSKSKQRKFFIKADIKAAANSVNFSSKFPFDPERNVVFDEYGGRALTEGSAYTTRIDLDVSGELKENFLCGVTFSEYSQSGNPAIAYTWGVLPPYEPSGYSLDKDFANTSFLKTTFNKIWLKSKGAWNINGIYGEFYPEMISPLVFYVQRSPQSFNGALGCTA